MKYAARLTDGTRKTDESVDVVSMVDVVRDADRELSAAVAVANHDSSQRTCKIAYRLFFSPRPPGPALLITRPVWAYKFISLAGVPRYDVTRSRDVISDVINRFCPATFLKVPSSKQPPFSQFEIFSAKNGHRHARRTALSAIDPSRLPVRLHGTSCLSVYVTLGYC